MSKTIEITDEQHETLMHAARQRGQSIQLLIAEMAEELRDPEYQPRYFDTDDWFRHLGMSDDRIREVHERLARCDNQRADADA